MRNKIYIYGQVLFIYTLCLFSLSNKVLAQDRADNTSWSSISISSKIDSNWTATLKPIFRTQNDFSTYQNTSLDYIVRRKWTSNTAFQLLGRTWFIPNGTNRQFIFIDLLHQLPIKNSSVVWKNRFRIHYAFDIDEQVDGDFFRLDSQFTLNKPWKVIPWISAEPFFRLDGDAQEIQRVRYILGGQWKIKKNVSLTGQYWRENFYNGNATPDFNIWVLNLGYKI